MAGIFTRFTLRSLTKNRVRTVVTVAGIALSTALLAAVLTSVASVQAGLYERTASTEGTWQIFTRGVSEQTVANLAADDRVVDLALMREVGMAELSEEEADYIGKYVAVRELPAVEKGSWEPDGMSLAKVPALIEGRMPEAPGEIVLPDYSRDQELGGAGARSDGPLSVGSTLELDLGTRMIETDDGTIAAGSFEVDPVSDDGEPLSEIVDAQTQTYTVVGFYERQPPFGGDYYSTSASSIVALTVTDNSQEGTLAAYVTTRGVTSLDAMKELATAAGAPDTTSTIYHTNLFRYQGIDVGNPIWGTLWMVAAVLAVVIVVASVSLIYNAFAISVAERTRQFGLLASLGASKRQLRRSVLVEALVLGVVGIPLGLVLGVAGTAGVFAVTQEAFATMFGNETGLTVQVEPLVLVVAAVLSLATLLASAWVPSARAARVSAVDAIRQTQDVHLSKRAERKAAASTDGKSVKLGLAGRLFGIPGFVAHRNLSRSTARGRTVVASLAVGTLLIVTTGSLSVTMTPIMERTESMGGAGSGADVIVSAHIDYSSANNDALLSERAKDLDRFLTEARALDGVEFLGSARQGQTYTIIPGDMVTTEARDVRERFDAERLPSYYPRSFGADGAYYGEAALFYLDDASWRALVDELGLDEATFSDPANPRAIGLNTFQSALPEGTYVSTKPFAEPGIVELFTIHDREGFSTIGISEGEDGMPAVGFVDFTSSSNEEIDMVPASEVTTSLALEVGALTDDEPAALNTMAASSRFPAFILPESATMAGGSGESPLTFSFMSFSFKADDHAKAAEELEALGTTYSGVTFNVADITESTRQNRLMMQAMQLFVLCFSIITTLIAVANVFNTLANSIILRTREFAVLRSTGMGNRAFARMLAYECASYAIRGLVVGLAVAIAVAFLLYQATTQSFTGLAFTLPWPYIGAAVAVVLAVLVLSVAYALHRARAGSIVEALRTDAI